MTDGNVPPPPTLSTLPVRADPRLTVEWLVDGAAWLTTTTTDGDDGDNVCAAHVQTNLVDASYATARAVFPASTIRLCVAFDLCPLVPLHRPVATLSARSVAVYESVAATTQRPLHVDELARLPARDACASALLEWQWLQHLVRTLVPPTGCAVVSLARAPNLLLLADPDARTTLFDDMYRRVAAALKEPPTPVSPLTVLMTNHVVAQQLLASPVWCAERAVGPAASSSSSASAIPVCSGANLFLPVTTAKSRDQSLAGEAIAQLVPRAVTLLTRDQKGGGGGGAVVGVLMSSNVDALALMLGALAAKKCPATLPVATVFLGTSPDSFIDVGAFYNWLYRFYDAADSVRNEDGGCGGVPLGMIGYMLALLVAGANTPLQHTLLATHVDTGALDRSPGGEFLTTADRSVTWYLKAWARVLQLPKMFDDRVPYLALAREAAVRGAPVHVDDAEQWVASHLWRLLKGVPGAPTRSVMDAVLAPYGTPAPLKRVEPDAVAGFLRTPHEQRFFIDLRVLASPLYVWTAPTK